MRSKKQLQAAIVTYAVVACSSFLVLMCAVCMALRPQLFDHPHWGISYFGAQRVTLLPYYLGFAIVIGCLARITVLIWPLKNQWRPLRGIFLVATLLSAGIALTSYMQGPVLFWSHMVVCLALSLLVVGGEIWILRRPGNTWLDYTCFALLLASLLIINMSRDWWGVLGVYSWGEVPLFIAAFGCLGSAAVRAIESD